MLPLKRALIVLSAAALAACGDDRSVNPVAEFVDGNGAAITTGGTLVAQYSLLVGQSVKIIPKTTTRTNRLRWSTLNSSIASVNSQGTVTARATGSTTVQVSGTGVLENYAITVTAPAAPKVTSFSLQPKTGVSLTSGQSQQFAASATWSDGMQYPITVSYTATGGTISGTGLFTAGNLAGTFMVVATCACTSPAIADTSVISITAPAVLSSLSLTPATVSLSPGGTQQFTPSAGWSTGATNVPPVTYTATGGTVSASGLYTAPSTAGTYRVIVAHTGGTLRDTSEVTVGSTTATEATIVSFRAHPTRVVLLPGEAQNSSARATYSDGSAKVPSLTHSVIGGGTISRGVYTAPMVPGTYGVVVRATGTAFVDTMEVVVEQPQTPPTTIDRLLFSDGFESGGYLTRQNGVYWESTPWTEVISGHARAGGARSARLNQGNSKNWGELRFAGLPRLSEVFVQYYLYQPSGLESPAVGPKVVVPVDGENDKFIRLWSESYTRFTVKYGASTWGTGGVGGIGSEFGTNGSMGEGGNSFRQVNKFPFIGRNEYLGRWVKVQVRAKVATPANNDGILQVWIDGVLATNKKHLPTYPTNGVSNFFEAGYLMGWANSGFQPGQYMYVDDVTISTGGFPR
jgi:hypothetical protein